MSEGERAAAPRPLHKTTIVIWSEDPGGQFELEHLAREAASGEAFCSRYRNELVERPERDRDWEPTEFFDSGGTMSGKSEQRDEKKRVGVQLSVTVVVTDREALLAYVKRRYAACWLDSDWEPAGLSEAVLEALVVSNENPTPDEYGIEIVKTEATEVPGG